MSDFCNVENCRSISKVSPDPRMCWTHYRRAKGYRGQAFDSPVQAKRTGVEVCALDGCEKPEVKLNWCARHYDQYKKGRPLTLIEDGKWQRGGEKKKCGLDGCYAPTPAWASVCQRHRTLATKYGMTQEGLVGLWRDGSCHCCGEHGVRMSIDHDHGCCPVGNGRKCGKCTRGLLCHRCNIAAGNAKDSPEILRSLADYIEKGGAYDKIV